MTQPQPGTMLDTKGTDTPFGIEGKIPGAETGKASEEEKLYTQKQADAFVHAAKSEAGREAKKLERERDDFKSKLEAKDGDIEDISQERETLRKQIEDLSSDDPRKFDLIKMDRQLKDREQKLKTSERELKAQIRANEARLAKAEAFEVDVLCEEIAEDYDDGDSKKLRNLCKTTGVKDEEIIRGLADTLWSKKTPQSGGTTPALKTLPGHTAGGGTESLAGLLNVNIKKLTFQERLEHQKKLESARASLVR